MKALRALAFVFLALLASPPALSQGNTASLVKLSNGTVLSQFIVGNDTQSIAWDGGRYAWGGTDGGGLARIDLDADPPAMDRLYPYEGPIFISGSRAIVSEALLDLSTDPPTVITPLPEHAGAAFFAGGNRAILVQDHNIVIVDAINSGFPRITTFAEMLPDYGLMVAVNPAGTKAIVTLDDIGGAQVLNISDIAAPLRDGVVFQDLIFEEPLGVAVAPDGRYAIYVNEDRSNPQAVVVDISVSLEPWIVTAIPLELNSPSSITINPTTAEAVIAGDNGLAILKPPYTSVDRYHFISRGYGTTTYGLAVNSAGTHAITLHEDYPRWFDVDPMSLVFGLQEVGTVSARQTVTVNNRDVTPFLTFNSITVSGPFLLENRCPAALAPDPRALSAAAKVAIDAPMPMSCALDVLFAPTVGGNGQVGWLKVVTNQGTWVARLTGDASVTRQARVRFDPPAISFGEVVVGGTATRSLTIVSNGSSPLTITSISMNGPFQFLSNCVTVIPPGLTCSMVVAFNPTALGAVTGELVFAHDATGSATTVPIYASGVPPPAPRIQLAPARMEFPFQGLGTVSESRKAVVKNIGNAPLHVSSVSSDSTEFLVTSQCSGPLDPGQECVVTIKFAPFSSGLQDGSLIVGSDAANTRRAVLPLVGVGCRQMTMPDRRTGRPLCVP
jgi:hypothetical protein